MGNSVPRTVIGQTGFVAATGGGSDAGYRRSRSVTRVSRSRSLNSAGGQLKAKTI
jgi:hypothetical protein